MPHNNTLEIYDSLYPANERIEETFHCFWLSVKQQRGWTSDLKISYPIVEKQTDQCSCGLFALSFIKNLYTGIPLPVNLQNQIENIRLNICSTVLTGQI